MSFLYADGHNPPVENSFRLNTSEDKYMRFDMREITCEELKKTMTNYRLIDVRTPEEFTGELGHIPGSELQPLSPDFMQFLKTLDPNEKIVFVCRSGARSGQTTLWSEELGFTDTYNMVGGMIKWNELGYETRKGDNT